jgi:hypothetical protein
MIETFYNVWEVVIVAAGFGIATDFRRGGHRASADEAVSTLFEVPIPGGPLWIFRTAPWQSVRADLPIPSLAG